MKVRAKIGMESNNKNNELVSIFIKGKEYFSAPSRMTPYGYIVIDELGDKNLFSDARFKRMFEIINEEDT